MPKQYRTPAACYERTPVRRLTAAERREFSDLVTADIAAAVQRDDDYRASQPEHDLVCNCHDCVAFDRAFERFCASR